MDKKRKISDDSINQVLEQDKEIYNELAKKLGGQIVNIGSSSQIMIVTTNKYIGKFYRHPINRNINEEWVQNIKNSVLNTIMAKESMVINVAFDSRDAKREFYGDPDDTSLGVKAIILDGQHRWQAMMEINEYHPDKVYTVILMVYIVHNDKDIMKRISDINKRLPYSQEDMDRSHVKTTFYSAFEEIVTSDNMKRRCIQNVCKSSIINDLSFVKKHKNKTKDDFITALNEVSKKYEKIWMGEREKNTRITTGRIIEQYKLYQLTDETCNWMKNL
jgi:hypothetical protein